MSVLEVTSCLKPYKEERGLLVSSEPSTKAVDLVIIDGGVVGTNEARLAVGFGARVTIFDIV